LHLFSVIGKKLYTCTLHVHILFFILRGTYLQTIHAYIHAHVLSLALSPLPPSLSLSLSLHLSFLLCPQFSVEATAILISPPPPPHPSPTPHPSVQSTMERSVWKETARILITAPSRSAFFSFPPLTGVFQSNPEIESDFFSQLRIISGCVNSRYQISKFEGSGSFLSDCEIRSGKLQSHVCGH